MEHDILPGLIAMVLLAIVAVAAVLFPGQRIQGQQAGGITAKKVSIILAQGIVDFGQLNVGDTADTLAGAPGPFVVENNGNVRANIKIEAGDLWSMSPNPSSMFQFLSAEKETGSVTNPATDLVATWTDMPPSGGAVFFAKGLKAADANDELFGHLQVQVPPDETTGQKQAIVTFTASIGQTAPLD